MANIRALFMDLGDTYRIVTKNPPFSAAARKRIAEICGTDMSPDDYFKFINARYDVYREWALHYMCEAPEDELWTRWLVPELDKDYIRANASELTYCFRACKGERLVVDKGIETVRELIKRGYKVGIISDIVGTKEVDEWLDKDGIRDLFCTVQQSSVTMLRKPHPAIYYLACKEAGVRPEEVVFIGDNLMRDITGAKAANFGGTICAAYANVKKPENFTELNNPDCYIYSFDKLLDILPGDGQYLPEKGERSLR